MGQFDRKAQSQPKHGKPSSSGASKSPAAPGQGRPGWKGPSITPKVKRQHRALSEASKATTPVILEHLLPVELQQLMLDVFRDALPVCNDFEALKPTLRAIKDALLERDLGRAFENEELLEAYAVRWSPSRALGFSNLLAWICTTNKEYEWIQSLSHAEEGGPAKVVCFGGGAAELVAFAGVLRSLIPSASGRPTATQTFQAAATLDNLNALSYSGGVTLNPSLLELHLVDAASWSSVVLKLLNTLNKPPALSKYASAAARASNKSFLAEEAMKVTFTKADIFKSSIQDLRTMVGPGPVLITLLFTLDDLYATSVPETTGFLLKLTAIAPKGALLLVADSSDSHTDLAAGQSKDSEERKKYPMQWLLDHTLVPTPREKDTVDETNEPAWEKVLGEESMSYKMEGCLTYPASLENIKFQVHLFRHL
ncbi:hypothetical protein GQ53DRAFT_8278 [Thozetella sp. PMI_491]|nr:hypothetical protein GQ53DRAFT_8278 [Thozetella sp. PMI_491]